MPPWEAHDGPLETSEDDEEEATHPRQRRKLAGLDGRRRSRRPSWTREEEEVLARQHSFSGNAWSTIAEFLPGRTAGEVKNIWHSTLRSKKLKCRSLLRAYARAVHGREDDDGARAKAFLGAVRLTGSDDIPPLPLVPAHPPQRSSSPDHYHPPAAFLLHQHQHQHQQELQTHLLLQQLQQAQAQLLPLAGSPHADRHGRGADAAGDTSGCDGRPAADPRVKHEPCATGSSGGVCGPAPHATRPSSPAHFQPRPELVSYGRPPTAMPYGKRAASPPGSPSHPNPHRELHGAAGTARAPGPAPSYGRSSYGPGAAGYEKSPFRTAPGLPPSPLRGGGSPYGTGVLGGGLPQGSGLGPLVWYGGAGSLGDVPYDMRSSTHGADVDMAEADPQDSCAGPRHDGQGLRPAGRSPQPGLLNPLPAAAAWGAHATQQQQPQALPYGQQLRAHATQQQRGEAGRERLGSGQQGRVVSQERGGATRRASDHCGGGGRGRGSGTGSGGGAQGDEGGGGAAWPLMGGASNGIQQLLLDAVVAGRADVLPLLLELQRQQQQQELAEQEQLLRQQLRWQQLSEQEQLLRQQLLQHEQRQQGRQHQRRRGPAGDESGGAQEGAAGGAGHAPPYGTESGGRSPARLPHQPPPQQQRERSGPLPQVQPEGEAYGSHDAAGRGNAVRVYGGARAGGAPLLTHGADPDAWEQTPAIPAARGSSGGGGGGGGDGGARASGGGGDPAAAAELRGPPPNYLAVPLGNINDVGLGPLGLTAAQLTAGGDGGGTATARGGGGGGGADLGILQRLLLAQLGASGLTAAGPTAAVGRGGAGVLAAEPEAQAAARQAAAGPVDLGPHPQHRPHRPQHQHQQLQLQQHDQQQQRLQPHTELVPYGDAPSYDRPPAGSRRPTPGLVSLERAAASRGGAAPDPLVVVRSGRGAAGGRAACGGVAPPALAGEAGGAGARRRQSPSGGGGAGCGSGGGDGGGGGQPGKEVSMQDAAQALSVLLAMVQQQPGQQ